ncbi:tetratricopeptide repeat protein [Horticoccus sp. 23ND18S-11]|uniref:tetratricopeptide repeat protein n=1 Tax=Horticoccus sp. 23ND18S-11 TaxID=3391832 RepID=UPI0039C9B069
MLTGTVPPASPSPPAPARPQPWLIALVLVVLTLLTFWRVGQCDFVNLDDDAYVQFQPLVNQGLRAPGIVWAFTGTHSNNWHPLTTLSHQLDCEIFGVKPAPMHWENLGWHVLNTLLVFLVGRALTGATWRPAVVAAFFAVHPLHVESVAWISERKDLLSGFFWLLGLWAYRVYARAPSVRRYLLVAAAMVFALLAKPMAVTFPCTLLLLDFWPLRRWPERSWRALVIEKLPLFALVAAHSVLTFIVQSATGAAHYGERFSLGVRVANALVAYVRYLGKTFWPESLAPMYHHPGHWPVLVVAGACVILGLLSLAAWRWRHRQPSGLFGWLWFLGTLVPVIGLVQVGAQSMADRYMYLPILGVLTPAVWIGAHLLERWPRPRVLAIGASAAIAVGLGLVAARQVLAWRNSVTLFEHSIKAGEDNAPVRYLLAVALQGAGRPATEVAAQFHRALELSPDYVNARTQLAAIAIGQQNYDEARRHIEDTIRIEPENAALHVNLGALWMRVGRPADAIPHFEQALRLNPDSGPAHLELARIFLGQNRLDEARAHIKARAELEPWNPDALADYGNILLGLKRFEEGRTYLTRALWIRPDFALARQSLEALNAATGSKG